MPLWRRDLRWAPGPRAEPVRRPEASARVRTARRGARSDVGESVANTRFLTVQEVADLMRVSTMTVYRMIRSGDLPAVRVGRSFRVRDDDLAAYLGSRSTRRA